MYLRCKSSCNAAINRCKSCIFVVAVAILSLIFCFTHMKNIFPSQIVYLRFSVWLRFFIRTRRKKKQLLAGSVHLVSFLNHCAHFPGHNISAFDIYCMQVEDPNFTYIDYRIRSAHTHTLSTTQKSSKSFDFIANSSCYIGEKDEEREEMSNTCIIYWNRAQQDLYHWRVLLRP